MAGSGVLAFGWAGAAYAAKKRHFGLALTGAVSVLISCIAEFFLLSYLPIYGDMKYSPVFVFG
jgi:hypothetical protein